jgi:hypothetical protein
MKIFNYFLILIILFFLLKFIYNNYQLLNYLYLNYNHQVINFIIILSHQIVLKRYDIYFILVIKSNFYLFDVHFPPNYHYFINLNLIYFIIFLINFKYYQKFNYFIPKAIFCHFLLF